jgi:hypothetical protein
MRVWCEIFDATYTVKLGRLDAIVASYQRKLDEAGTGSSTFASDPKNLGLIRVRRIIEIWISDTKLKWNESLQAQEKETFSRKIGTFIIKKIKPNPDDKTIMVRGTGVMSKLANKTTLPGLAFENQSVSSVLTSLAALAGWTVSADVALNSQYISVRFAGENILRALAVVAQSQGIHIRESSTANQIEAGAFGTVESFADYGKGDAGDMVLYKEAPMLIESVDLTEESEEVVNKIYVYGGGDGDAALTMDLADRGFVDSEVANDRTHYFIVDSASVSLYGEVAKRLDIKRISPTSPSDSAEIYASTALADAGKAWLDRNSMPYELLKLSVQNVNETLMPGSKVHVRYKETINLLGVPYQERDIDEAYWLMSIEENVGADGLEVVLNVANLDRYETNAADIVVGMIDSINVQNVNIQPYPAPYYWPTPAAPIDTLIPYNVNFYVNAQAVRLNQAVLYVFRRSWKAIGGIASGGGHRHLMFKWIASEVTAAPTSRQVYKVSLDGDTLTEQNVPIYGAYADDLYTWDAPDHDHDLVFNQVVEDDAANLLSGVEVKIDGVTISENLFPSGNTDDYAEVDITDALKAGTLRGFHELEVSCTEGRGDVYGILFIDIDVSRVRSN